MEKKHKDLLNDHMEDLCTLFQGSTLEICDFMHNEAHVFSLPLKQSILSEKTEIEVGYEIVHKTCLCGPKAFQGLYEAVKKSGLYEACDLLMPENAPHDPAVDDPSFLSTDPEVPAIPLEEGPWPSRDYMESLLSQLEVSKTMDTRQYEDHIGNDDFYQMTQRERGQPLVVFDESRLLRRDGNALNSLFRGLNFKSLETHKVENIQDLDKLDNHMKQDCDCFVVIVNASENGFLNTEGLQLIKNKTKQATNLYNKPKLFFHLTSNSASPASPTRQMDDVSSSGINGEGGVAQEDSRHTGDRVDGPIAMGEMDWCTVTATRYGCEVLELENDSRTCVEITRFIHLLADIFSKHANKLQWIDLLGHAVRTMLEIILSRKKGLAQLLTRRTNHEIILSRKKGLARLLNKMDQS